MTADEKREYMREWRARNPDYHREWARKNEARIAPIRKARIAEKRAAGWKPEYDAEYHRAYHAAHSKERSAKRTVWAQENRERQNALNAKWKRTNPESRQAHENTRRARLRAAGGGGLTRREWIALRSEYGDRCAYCLATTVLQMDHVDPLSRGGLHDASNIVPACQSCNASKNDNTLIVWFAKRAS